jgi:hypothetical protein
MNAETRIVCSKCGRSEEFGAALTSGWLYHQRADAPEGYMVIRCPEHISEHARRLAGLPQQVRTKRVQDNLDRGLWANAGTRVAVVSANDGEYMLSFRAEIALYNTSQSFVTIDELIAAMREVEPDLRRWHLCEAE